MPAPPAAASLTYGSDVRSSTAPDAVAIWTPLLAQIRSTVQECNALAGEPLWKMSERHIDPIRLSICHAGHPSRCLELSLQPAAATLRCVYGRAAGGATLELSAAGGGIRTAGRDFTVSETVAFLLQSLVAGLD